MGTVPEGLQAGALVARHARSGRVWAFGKCFGVVTLGTDGSCQWAAKFLGGAQPVNDETEVISRLPSQLNSRQSIDVDAIDLRQHRPSTPPILRLVAWGMPPDDGGRVLAQLVEVVGSKRRGCADDVSA